MCSRASSCRDLHKFRELRGFRSEDQEERCPGLFTSEGESQDRVKEEGGSDKERILTCLLLVFVQLFEKESTSGMVQVLRVESSVPRYHRTWRAGGVNVGEAAGSVSEDSSLFLERLTGKEVVLKRV